MKIRLLDKATERIRGFYGGIEQWVASLSRREKIMVGGMGAVFVVFIIGGAALLIGDAIGELEETVAEKSFKLNKINAEQAEYLSAKAELQRVKALISRKERGCSLFKFLEEEAKKLEIELGDIKKLGVVGDRSALILENDVEIAIREITLSKLTDYLFALEKGACMLKVVKLRVRARGPENERKLNASFTVANYTLNPEMSDDKPQGVAPKMSEGKEKPPALKPTKTIQGRK
ncbi:MAG: hypothetical protein Kow0090_04150 [Myxococcota bacterium]